MATTGNEVKTDQGLVKGLGLMDSTTLVVGSMIGSGIFIVSADIARQVNSPGLLLMTWVATAVLTLIAALSYGELAAAMPQAGGQYVYLRESFGPLSGFLYGWTLFLVIQTGTIAAVAVAFAKFAGVFVPWISAQNHLIGSGKAGLTTQQLVGIVIVGLLSAVNMRGIRTGAMVQNVFTFAKTAALLGLVAIGFLLGRNPEALTRNFGHFWDGAGWSMHAVRLVGVAMVGVAVLGRRLEQRDVHRGRGAQPAAQSADLAGAGRGHRDGAIHLGQLRVPECAAAGSASSTRPKTAWPPPR